MIIEFSIRNFGSIRDKQTLSFEASRSDDLADHYLLEGTGELRLLKMAMIYGANASGKTTILKALDFLRHLVLDPAEKKNTPLDFNPFLFDLESRNKTSEIWLDFLRHGVRYSYNIEFTQQAIISEELQFSDPRPASLFKRVTDIDRQYSEIVFGGKVKKDRDLERQLSANTLWNNSVLGGFLKTNVVHEQLTQVNGWFQEYLSPIIHTSSELDDFVTESISDSVIKKGTCSFYS
jgi:energy-coupling factor transporter ATP-binding protein EcfA2